MSTQSPGLLRPGTILYFIRHGETDWNRDARYQGQRDIPLNATGRAQAKRHGDLLKSLLSDPTAVDFVSSPLGRASETMRIVRTALGLNPEAFATDDRIVELSYGHWEGELAAELPSKDPAGVAAKSLDPFHWRPIGGESYADLEARISPWLGGIKKTTVAVSHGGVSRVARGALYDLDRATVPFLAVPQDQILELRSDNLRWL
ncbi:histidine phosphatase family protein [Hyphomicrobium methylovorum]|uniref:histidine phosphatase family protein n=1 Tax=Hyphomicrobium methylovorum TaxID=84 RepID=UPI0015E6CF44|nr:histidine phosphatase family protein [Hyphomicrobium methylovorum]MBA2127302.1 histidine phosphatase family protein [Hyphomicrobium methylovorum]